MQSGFREWVVGVLQHPTLSQMSNVNLEGLDDRGVLDGGDILHHPAAG